MKELVVVSGKGGTGKTAVTSSFAALAESVVLVDADVDAANLELVLSARKVSEEPFSGGSAPYVNRDLCAECGICAEVCPVDAVGFELPKFYGVAEAHEAYRFTRLQGRSSPVGSQTDAGLTAS